jgi:hypothetical protein
MKVFDTMLKSDGIDDNEIKVGGNKSWETKEQK